LLFGGEQRWELENPKTPFVTLWRLGKRAIAIIFIFITMARYSVVIGEHRSKMSGGSESWLAFSEVEREWMEIFPHTMFYDTEDQFSKLSHV